MTRPSEKQLDRALDDAIRTNADFTQWFLSRTKFAAEDALYLDSRSNHPWSKFPIGIRNAETGLSDTVQKEGETDILVIFVTHAKKRFAIHIENKRGSGKFTPLQPELYRARAAAWKGNPKYGSYEDWEIILVAPRSFYERFRSEAEKFDRFIAYEEIAAYLPLFKIHT